MIEVGSTSLTRDQVAELTGVTPRTVRSWEQKGLLNRLNDEGPALYDKTLVLQLEEARKKAATLDTKYKLVNLEFRVEKLEKMMDIVRMIYEIRRAPMEMDPDTHKALLLHAGQLLQNPRAITLEDMQQWSLVFPQLDENFFSWAADLTGDNAIWSMVYDLCLLMQKKVARIEGFDQSLDLQMLHAALDHGRRELRPTILLYLSQSGACIEDLHSALFGSGAGPKEAVLQKLAGNRNS